MRVEEYSDVPVSSTPYGVLLMPKRKQDKWQILRYDDISYANRKRARVQGLIINGPLDEIEIALAGHDALAFANKYMPGVQGVALFLWADREKVGKEEAIVSIHWCPHGKWEYIGEYPVTDNVFHIEFNKQGGVDAKDSDSSDAGRSSDNPS